MLTERTGGISIIGGEEEVAMKEIGKGDGVGKSELLDNGVYSRSQSLACSMERRQEVHSGVVMLDDRVAGEED